MELDKQVLLSLYTPFTSVLGPYKRKDGRMHVVLNDSAKSKSDKSKTKTISYPKALFESNANRRLVGNETIDHDNRMFEDNTGNNLIVRSLATHASLDALRVEILPVECSWCGTEFIPTRHQSDMSKAGPFCSKLCAGQYGAHVQNGGFKIEPTQIIKDYYRVDK